MKTNKVTHLSKEERIKLGSYYTPGNLVNLVVNLIEPYSLKNKKDLIIFDNAAGCGAFLEKINRKPYRAADCDPEAVNFLKKHFDKKKIFLGNSLIGTNRSQYSISDKKFLIMVGNPPYNDTTSEFKNGQKGKISCDPDLKDRDLGISFLKSYDKLKADVVCVLHPFSYLIKETNFKRLKNFKDNYKLKKGILFPSSLFSGTGSIKFPIMIGLYERDEAGMDFKYIQDFRFSTIDNNRKFQLSKYETTDGYINKYPPRKNDPKDSPLNLYFYTFRDFNSLRKNTSFFSRKHYNGIVVTLENFYKYAYLDALKSLFQPKDSWLYGNLSPLVNQEFLEKNKEVFIEYVLQKKNLSKILNQNLKKQVIEKYGIRSNKIREQNDLELIIKNHFQSFT